MPIPRKYLIVIYSLRALMLPVIYLLCVFLHGWLSDWQPEGQTRLIPDSGGDYIEIAEQDTVLSFLAWNIGYAGLGAESDFFFDDQGIWYSGSSMVFPPQSLSAKNMTGIKQTLANTKADFFLLQEVDELADRSHRINQHLASQRVLIDYWGTFAPNYKCTRVPIPILEPWNHYGYVQSGLSTFSRFQFRLATRYQLPGKYPMPDRMFQLDRCVALHRYALKNGKQLVVMNVHNSAHDPGGKIKAIQLPFLRDLAVAEYKQGNYVVLGGDWNQCPPNFRFDSFMPGNTQGYLQGNVPSDMFPDDWRFAYDPTVPTNRKCRDPYVRGKTFVTLIDYFLVSPNIQVKAVKCLDQQFQFSDHQPVWMEVVLR
ncbi:MAG: endonuclease/exonuclease/phosphatase family protein [Saprospiraceae bacterium]